MHCRTWKAEIENSCIGRSQVASQPVKPPSVYTAEMLVMKHQVTQGTGCALVIEATDKQGTGTGTGHCLQASQSRYVILSFCCLTNTHAKPSITS